MTNTINIFSALQIKQLRKNYLQQSAFAQQIPANRRFFCKHYFIQFIGNAFLRNNLYTVRIFFYGIECICFYCKTKLRCKPNSTHHAQWIIAESLCRFERRFY